MLIEKKRKTRSIEKEFEYEILKEVNTDKSHSIAIIDIDCSSKNSIYIWFKIIKGDEQGDWPKLVARQIVEVCRKLYDKYPFITAVINNNPYSIY